MCASRRKISGGESTAGGARADAVVPHRADLIQPSTEAPRNHRELAEAIFAKCDAVKVGRELLESSSEKGASVRARVFETLANWQFGKSAAEPSSGRAGLQIIWDIPGPPRESEEPE
jgi:hypothetical protein